MRKIIGLFFAFFIVTEKCIFFDINNLGTLFVEIFYYDLFCGKAKRCTELKLSEHGIMLNLNQDEGVKKIIQLLKTSRFHFHKMPHVMRGSLCL